jgi:hypothetical protein
MPDATLEVLLGTARSLGVRVDAKPNRELVRKAASGAVTLGQAAGGSTDRLGVVAAFCQLNIRDRQGDVVLPGAIPTTDVLLSAWQHGSHAPGVLPVGRGSIREESGWAVFRGAFWSTPSGRETFEVVKQGGELIEWSFGFFVVDAEPGRFHGEPVRFLKKLDIFECSPVIRGAGMGTATLETSASPALQLEIARAARDNDRALAGLARYDPIAGFAPDGRPIRRRRWRG